MTATVALLWQEDSVSCAWPQLGASPCKMLCYTVKDSLHPDVLCAQGMA